MKVVKIRLASADTQIELRDDALTQRVARHDVGTGFVLSTITEDVDGVLFVMHKIAVIDGRFDSHRNVLGELWVNDSEIA